MIAAARLQGHDLQVVSPTPFRAVRASTALATDDWPHLYLASPRIPHLYYEVLGFIVVLTLLSFVALQRVIERSAIQGPPQLGRLLHFALLGASFMLLETRAITQFALLFGSTWAVNAIVISSILCVIFLGNKLLQTRDFVSRAVKQLVYLALLGCLVTLNFLPLDALLPFDLLLRIAAAALVIGAPVFGASLIFSDSFRRAPDGAPAFGANLVGVVLGGALEYSSMQLGLKFLYLIAAVMYALAWLAERLAKTSDGATTVARATSGGQEGVVSNVAPSLSSRSSTPS